MRVFRSLEEAAVIPKAATATIGNFDSIHIGHQALLHRAKELAHTEGDQSTVITFANHPAQILRPEVPIKTICTLSHKIKLIGDQGIDNLLLLDFTEKLSELSAETFIEKVRSSYPFKHLILGYDAALGKGKHGNRKIIEKAAAHLGFSAESLSPITIDGDPVSSSKIRAHLVKGDLQTVERLLGRQYSIYSCVIPGSLHGRAIGFPTANIDVQGLCLPPLGVYAVTVLHEGKAFPAVANLGTAPTIKDMEHPLLEVHLLNYDAHLYDNHIEVVFCEFLRPEEKFPSTEALRQQIAQDIERARKMLVEYSRGRL